MATSAGKLKLGRLRAAVKGSGRVCILTHDNPDPDAMAGALCLLHVVSEAFGLEGVLLYGGIIGRADNRAMVELCEIPLCHIESYAALSRDRFICVDTQPSFTNNSLPEDADLVGVIDHHPLETDDDVPFLDVRPGYGSVAAILAEYVFHAGLELGRSLATAIAFGIASETEDLGREASEADVAAYVRVLPRVDHRVLGQLRHPALSRAFYRTLAGALQAARLCGDVVICHVGAVHTPDEVAQVADFLNSMAESGWALCTGEYRGSVIVSLRTSDDSANAGRVLERALEGKGSAGGHGMIAGGQLPLDGRADAREVHRELAETILAELGYGRGAPTEPLLRAGADGGE